MTVLQQLADADHVAWLLSQYVGERAHPLFAPLRLDPAGYARTLARLIGQVWSTGTPAEAIIGEELRRLSGQAPSSAYQAACDVAARYQGPHGA